MKYSRWTRFLQNIGCGLLAFCCLVGALSMHTATAVAATYSSWFSDKETVTDYAYSFAVVGDPQYVTYRYASQLPNIYDWILANKEAKNIQHVFGLGDTVHCDFHEEWTTAKAAISKMDGKISYSLVRGNHDSTSKLNGYFYYDKYINQFGGFYKVGDIANSWKTMTIGQTDYLLITLDYGATDEELAWASQVVETFPEYKVIVTTHAYLDAAGHHMVSIPEYDQDKNKDPDRAYNSGEGIWNKFVSKHPNIFLVMSGHVLGGDIAKLQSVGLHGNTVTQLMINPQVLDNNESIGPTGMVAMLYFSEDGSMIEVEYYSTIKQQYWRSINQFQISFPTTEMPDHIYDQEVIDEKYEKSAPTHMAFGEYYKSCKCGAAGEETFFGTEKLEGHEWQEIVDERFLHTAATCVDAGIYYKSCACGERSPLLFISDPLGHNWAGDCDERHCQREGCGLSSPINHKWDNGVVTKEATTEETGIKTYACTKCQDTKTEEIPMLTPVEPDTSTNSSEEKVESSMPTESVENAGGMLNCSSSIAGLAGVYGVLATAAFLILNSKWKEE